MPIPTVDRTGSGASTADFSLGSLIFDISNQSLSNVLSNSASSSSYLSKVEAVESKWDDFFNDIGGNNLPSYDAVCTGGGLTGLLKLAGCIASGLGLIKVGFEGIDTNDPGPALTEIEGVIANVAEMAQEEEREEDDDDDDDDDQPSTQNGPRASKTQQSSSASRNPVSSTDLHSSMISSSIPSSVSSTAVSSSVIPCDSIVPQALPAEYSTDSGAAEVVLDFVGDILLSVFGGEMSGFTTSTLADNSSSAVSGTAVVNSQGNTKSSSGGTPSPTASTFATLLMPLSSLPVYQCTLIYVPYPGCPVK